MNLGELQTAVDRRCGWDYESTAQIERINSAVRYISNLRDWPWQRATDLFDTVANQAVYSLPADWQRTRSVVGGGASYRETATEVIDDQARRDFTYVYSVDNGDELLIAPTPGGVFEMTHRYIQTENVLVASTDYLLLPPRFHDAVVDRVAAEETQRRGDLKQADAYKASFSEQIGVMRDELRRSTGTRQAIIRPGSGW